MTSTAVCMLNAVAEGHQRARRKPKLNNSGTPQLPPYHGMQFPAHLGNNKNRSGESGEPMVDRPAQGCVRWAAKRNKDPQSVLGSLDLHRPPKDTSLHRLRCLFSVGFPSRRGEDP